MLLRYMFKLFAVFALSIFVISGGVNALSTEGSNAIGSDFNKTQYFSGNNYEINEEIYGDLYCIGSNVSINSTVNGDILCTASTIVINGTVNGSVRLVASTIQINGLVTKNSTLIGQHVTIEKTGIIEGDVTTVTNLTIQNGFIGRDANVNTNNFEISGNIGRNLNLNTYSINFIGDYKVGSMITINSVVYDNLMNFQNTIQPTDTFGILGVLNALASAFMFVLGIIYVAFILGLLISALIIALLFPRSLQDSFQFAKNQPATVLLSGFLILWFAPMLIILLVWSIIGIPLALIVWGLYVALLTLSIPFSAHALGSKLFPSRSHAIKALGGAAIILLLLAIPILNIFVFVVVMIFGAGLITRITTLRYVQARQVYLKNKQSIN